MTDATAGRRMEKQVTLDGQTYAWDGAGWHNSKTYAVPNRVMTNKLNMLLRDELAKEDDLISNVPELLGRIEIARKNSDLIRAERLVRRAMTLEPGNPATQAVLCSILRELKSPQKALDETAAFSKNGHPHLLTSRAAAFCDLERWEDAKREVGRALAINKGKMDKAALSVVTRIKAARPELYDK